MVRRLFISATFCALTLAGGAYADTPVAAQGTDAEITNRVTQKLLQADSDVAPGIRVTTQNGVVTLEGNVSTQAQVLKVIRDASAVDGVSKVHNRLRVAM